MRKILSKTIAVVLCTNVITASCFAANMQGAYINGNLGATKFPAITFKDSNNNSLSLSSKMGWGGGLAFGSQNDNLRIELAANYWANRNKSATLSPNLSSSLSTNNGTSSITLAMLNGYYDFVPQALFTPYLGLGVGAARFRTDMLFDDSNKARVSHNDIAYQAIVGATWDVAPRVKTNLDYRYLLTGPQRMSVNQLSSSMNLRSTYQSHRISVGLTYYVY